MKVALVVVLFCILTTSFADRDGVWTVNCGNNARSCYQVLRDNCIQPTIGCSWTNADWAACGLNFDAGGAHTCAVTAGTPDTISVTGDSQTLNFYLQACRTADYPRNHLVNTDRRTCTGTTTTGQPGTPPTPVGCVHDFLTLNIQGRCELDFLGHNWVERNYVGNTVGAQSYNRWISHPLIVTTGARAVNGINTGTSKASIAHGCASTFTGSRPNFSGTYGFRTLCGGGQALMGVYSPLTSQRVATEFNNPAWSAPSLTLTNIDIEGFDTQLTGGGAPANSNILTRANTLFIAAGGTITFDRVHFKNIDILGIPNTSWDSDLLGANGCSGSSMRNPAILAASARYDTNCNYMIDPPTTVVFKSCKVLTEAETGNDHISQRLRNLITAERWAKVEMQTMDFSRLRFFGGNGVGEFNHATFMATTIMVTDSSINAAPFTGRGGFFFFHDATNATITGSTFQNLRGNTASSPTTTPVGDNVGGSGLVIAMLDDDVRGSNGLNFRSSLKVTTSTFNNLRWAGQGNAMWVSGKDVHTTFDDNTFSNSLSNNTIGSINAAGACYFLSGVIGGKQLWKKSATGNRAAHGGCVYITGASTMDITFASGVSIGNGGINTDISTHSRRSVLGGGGGFFINGGSRVIIRDATFNALTAQYGGAINVEDSTLYIVNSRFTNNKALFIANFSTDLHGAGGAIRSKTSHVEIQDSVFTDNHAHNGGDIYAFDTIDFNVGDARAGTLSVHSCRFDTTAFTAANAPNFGALWNGGSIYFAGARFFVDMSTFVQNYAKKGGAIYIEDRVDPFASGDHAIRIRKTRFTGNEARADWTTAAPNPTPGITPDLGGGAVASQRAIQFVDCTFESNRVSGGHGGAIMAMRGVETDNCTFTSNAAVNHRGGAIYALPSVIDYVTIRDSDFSLNVAAWGGAIFSRNPLTTLKGSVFENNQASLFGGAAYLLNRGVVQYSTFTTNEGSHGGGAIHTQDQLTVAGSRFVGNRASTTTPTVGAGGAIRCISNANGNVNSRLDVTDTAFSLNNAQGNGGAIWSSCNVHVSKSSFTGDVASATNSGGGIYCHNSNRRVRGCIIEAERTSFTQTSPNGIAVFESATIQTAMLGLKSCTFSGATSGVSAYADVTVYAPSTMLGVSSTLVTAGAQFKLFGSTHNARLWGLTVTNNGVVQIDTLAGAALANMGGDATSQLRITNTPVSHSGMSTGGAFGVSGSVVTIGAGEIKVLGSASWSGTGLQMNGPGNITLMAGTTTWTDGSVGAGGYIKIMPGATLAMGSNGLSLGRSIKNWGSIQIRSSGFTINNPVSLANGVHIDNAVGSTFWFGQDTSIADASQGGGMIRNWGNMTFNGLNTMTTSVFLYPQSILLFNIQDRNRFDIANFAGLVQFDGGIVVHDSRPLFLGWYEGDQDGDEVATADFWGQQYPLISLRSSYDSRWNAQFRHTRVRYYRNSPPATIVNPLPSTPPAFAVPVPNFAHRHAPPYIVYGVGSHTAASRSAIYFSTPASFVTASPILVLISMVFAALF